MKRLWQKHKKKVFGSFAFLMFFLMYGTVGAVECDTLPLFEGTIRSIIFLALWVLALLFLGEEHITIETVEKDRYAITTKRNGPNPKEKN